MLAQNSAAAVDEANAESPAAGVEETDPDAHEVVRVLRDADRIENVPYKSVKNYDKISEEAFGKGARWRIIGATNLIDTVKKFSAEDDR